MSVTPLRDRPRAHIVCWAPETEVTTKYQFSEKRGKDGRQAQVEDGSAYPRFSGTCPILLSILPPNDGKRRARCRQSPKPSRSEPLLRVEARQMTFRWLVRSRCGSRNPPFSKSLTCFFQIAGPPIFPLHIAILYSEITIDHLVWIASTGFVCRLHLRCSIAQLRPHCSSLEKATCHARLRATPKHVHLGDKLSVLEGHGQLA